VACQTARRPLDTPTLSFDHAAFAAKFVVLALHLLFVTTPEDCFSCMMKGGFVALRAAQRSLVSVGNLRLTALLVTAAAKDTVALRELLQYERLSAAIVSMNPRKAMQFFERSQIPAIYLFRDGLLKQYWSSVNSAAKALRRDEIAEAVERLGDDRAR
jgi:hypothetical protein